MRTRKREFLDEMNLVVPWAELVSLIAPHAPALGAKGARPPFAVETMLFALSNLWMLRRTLQRELLSPFSADERRVLGASLDRLQQSASRLRAAAGADLAGEDA